MRLSLLFGVFLFLLPCCCYSQTNPAKAAEDMRMETMKQRVQGARIDVTDEQPTPGKRRVDLTEVQKRTEELNGLVKSVNFDLANLRKGILAADLTEKLKKIEKLAKQLRQTLE